MKKLITVVALMLITVSANSQEKKGDNKDCYVQNATATFSLSDDKVEKLKDLIKEKDKAGDVIRTKGKANEISGDEVKNQMRANNRGYFNNMTKLTGKSKKEVMTFEKEVHKKCK